MEQSSFVKKITSYALTVPILIAATQFIVQVVFHNQYGYFRDEL